MAAGRCDLVIDQGEDWSAQFTFVDQYTRPMPMVEDPARMDIKNAATGATLHSMVTDLEIDPDVIPQLLISPDVALIQAHIPATVTKDFPPGSYDYDLFYTTSDDGAYADTQIVRGLWGKVLVRKRTTEDF